MSKYQPKWKRLGFKDAGEYSGACRAKKKTQMAALIATKANGKTLDILRIMWERAEFHEPVVSVTKEQLMSDARCSLDTVKSAMAYLRSEGSIFPIYMRGGRGLPSKYRLKVAGYDRTPSDDHIEVMAAERDREAAWRFLKGKYGPVKALEILSENPSD